MIEQARYNQKTARTGQAVQNPKEKNQPISIGSGSDDDAENEEYYREGLANERDSPAGRGGKHSKSRSPNKGN